MTLLLTPDESRCDRRRPAAGRYGFPQEIAAGAEHPLLADIGERDRAEEEVDLVSQFLPQVVGQAARLVQRAAARRAGGAARCSDRLVDGEDDVGDARLARRRGEQVAAAGAAHAAHEAALPKLREKLLQVRERDLLPLGDL